MEVCIGSSMGQGVVLCCLVWAIVLGQAWGTPIPPYQLDPLPSPRVPELNSRLSSINSRLQEQRFPLPSPQDLEAIKKVAQILVLLGEQVLPAIIGEPASPQPPPGCGRSVGGGDLPNDSASDS